MSGDLKFDINEKTGFLRKIQIAGKTLVNDNSLPPLFASLLQSSRFDGYYDFIGPDGGATLQADYHLDHFSTTRAEGADQLVATGRLTWCNDDAIHFDLRTLLHPTGHVRITLRAEACGAFVSRYLREFGLRLPLAMETRKRIIQGGDRGIRFDTRFMYQYHAHVKFLEAGDFNFWQHFYIDQLSPVDYHLWRSESLSTSGLSEFRGRRAPGWMTAYDQTGGVLMAYRDIPRAAPKSLYIHARDSGCAVVYLHAATHRAMDFADPAASANVFGIEHQTDWIFFAGPENTAQPEKTLAKIWSVPGLSSDGPVRADEELHAAAPEPELCPAVDAPLVVGGVPLPRGAIHSADQVALSQNDAPVPLQSRATAFWPDGSIKWLLLIFPLTADDRLKAAAHTGRGDELPLDVTLRKGQAARFHLHYGQQVKSASAGGSLTAHQAGDDVFIDTGSLKVVLGKGSRWLKEAHLEGKPLLNPSQTSQIFADFLSTEGTYPPHTTHPRGKANDGPLVINKIELEETGPLRAAVRLEGMTVGIEPARIILRVEAYAGRSCLRVFHSIEFHQKDPRSVHIRRMGMRLRLAGKQTMNRFGLTQDSPLHFSRWHKQADRRFREIDEQGNHGPGYLDCSDGQTGLCVYLRHMWEQAPAELTVCCNDGTPTFHINLWPETGPLMDVRRYSNYPHIAQGEDCHDDIDWVNKKYYAEEPFAGTSKTHELLLYFHGPKTAPLASLAADFERPPLIYAGYDWYAKTKVILPTVAPGDSRYARTARNLDNVADFILFHQKYWNWHGIWDYGDIGHMFKRGYGKFIPPERLRELLKLTPEQRAVPRDKEIGNKGDYWPQHDWAFDNGRWGWGNTESLPNLFMQMQYFRTGRRDVFFFVEALARQSRDVEMRHSGRFFGLGTRHGVQHWSDGNHEQRQTIHSELRYHYYLSGDARTADFLKELTDGYYLVEPITNENDADHSARLYGLLMRWEMTRDPALLKTLTNHVHSLCVPEGIATDMPVRFPSGLSSGKPRNINRAGMFFLYFGTLHALLEFHELTGDAVLRDAMIKYADAAKGDIVDGGQGEKYGPLFTDAFAARYAQDKEKYRRRLIERLHGMLPMAYQTVPPQASNWTGPNAPVIHFPIGLFWINEAGYVMTSLEREPEPTAEELAELQQKSRYFGPIDPDQPAVQIPIQRESWQSELDAPDLLHYTTPKRELEP